MECKTKQNLFRKKGKKPHKKDETNRQVSLEG